MKLYEDGLGDWPDELKGDQWLFYNVSEDKPKKPLNEPDGWPASWNDPDTWVSCEEALSQAEGKEEVGVGFVFANTNDDYDGKYGVIDIDGCFDADGEIKDWVPSLRPFFGREAYAELSPSAVADLEEGNNGGLHIPIKCFEPPEWWSNVAFSDREHEGVEAYGSKFCTVTGMKYEEAGDNVIDADDVDVEGWLREVYKEVTGQYPEDRNGSEEQDYDIPDEPPENLPYCTQQLAKIRMDPEARSSYSGSNGPFSVDTHLAQVLVANGYDMEECVEIFRDNPKKGDPAEFDERETRDHLSRLFNKKESLSPPFNALEPEVDWRKCNCQVHGDENDWRTLEGDLDWVLNRYYDDDDGIGIQTARHYVARAFDRHLEFAYPEEGAHSWLPRLHVYDDGDLIDTGNKGIYVSRGAQLVCTLAEEHLGPLFDNGFENQLIRKLERRNVVSAEDLETEPERLVVANGVLDLTTGELSAHTPNEYHQRRLGWDYDPDAQPERFDEFLDTVVDDQYQPLLYQFIAHTLYDDYPESKALMLHGSGSNGKTIFLTAVERFLGEGNYSELSLHDISDDPHCRDRIIGKFANISADLDDHEVRNLGVFKQMTGGDVININPKYEKTFPHRNTATMMFSANSIPKFNDNTRGNWRRWSLVPFPRDFDPDDDDYIPQEELLDQLTAETVMKGVLARAVEEIKAWVDGRAWFSHADGWKETRKKMQRAAYPVYDFAEVALQENKEGYITRENARNAFNQFAEENDVEKLSASQFGKRIKEVELTISSGQNRINGERKTTYQGVEFTGRGEQLLREYYSDDDQEMEPSSINDF